MGTPTKERIKRLNPFRSRQTSREQHDAAGPLTPHEATPTTSTDVFPQSSSPDHLKRYFPNGNTLGLSVLYSPENAQVDIIFIHGLMGDAYRTWTDDKAKVYWPVELLGKANNDARIIAFGYDSQVLGLFSSVGQNTLRGHADSILGHIANLRPASSDASKRKIILVVHSLGGLVAKKALCVSAQSPYKHLRQLHEKVHGILFLGTPHRGSDLAPNSQRLSRLFKLFGSAAVNPRILEPLLRDSPILEEVENDFGDWLKGKKEFEHITCFYEELEVPGVGFIVSKESATISGTPGPYSIHANHMQMAKFKSSDDPGFRLVHGELKRWIDATEKEIQPVEGVEAFRKKDVNRMLQSLAFLEMDWRMQLVKDTTPGTCSWAFDSATYKQFLGNGGLLWIKGKPGSGKSTLLRKIITTFRDNSDITGNIIASFFFWGSGSELQRSKLGLYRSLLHQLCQAMPQLCSEMTKDFLDKEATRGSVGQAWNWDERQLSDTLMDHLGRRPLPRRIWIFLDALDEAGEEIAKTVTEFLKDLLSATTEVDTSRSQSLGICFTCRHYPIIRAGTDLQMCLEDQNGPDISTHSRAMLVKWGMKPTDVEQLCTFIKKKAKGVFLWAQLVLDQIDKYHLIKTFRQIKKIIDTTPPELKQMYREKLQSINDQDKAQSLVILRWICFARVPLSLDHLRIALLLDSKRPEKTMQQCLEADDYIAEDDLLLNVVLNRTRGLAQKSANDTIQLIHQSVRDFLENDAGELGINCCHSHLLLFQSCLKVISFPEYLTILPEDLSLSDDEFLLSDEETSLSSKSSIPNEYASTRDNGSYSSDESEDAITILDESEVFHLFASYATMHWHHHALAAERGPRFDESVVHILDILFDYRIGLIWYFRYICYSRQRNYPFNGVMDYSRIERSRCTLLHAVAACGLLDVLKFAIGKRGLPIEPGKAKAPTLLHWAAACGQTEVAEWLLSSKTIDPDKQSLKGDTPLHWLIESAGRGIYPSKRILATLHMFAETPAVDWKVKNNKGSTALHEAASWDLFDVLQTVLRKRNININLYDNRDWTPLDEAIRKGREKTLEMVITTMIERLQSMQKKYFVERDTKVDSAYLARYLSEVSWPWRYEERWLVKFRQKYDQGFSYGITILHFAAQEGNIDLCQILINLGFKVEVKDESRREPLHRAAESGHLSIVKLLLDSGADTRARDVYGLSPAHLAIIQGHFDIAQILAWQLERSDHRSATPFFRAILDGNEKIAYKACLDDADRYRNSDEFVSPTLLQMAADTGDLKMAQASVTLSNLKVANGQTPLQLAIEKWHLEVVRFLLDEGSDPFDGDNLHLAAEGGHKEIVTLLISHGMDAIINQKRANDGKTPLQLAVERGNKSIVRELVNNGANIRVKDEWGKTPLHIAAANGYEDIVRDLVKYGGDTNAMDELEGGTPEDCTPESVTRRQVRPWLRLEGKIRT